jgi:hypothetical protein
MGLSSAISNSLGARRPVLVRYAAAHSEMQDFACLLQTNTHYEGVMQTTVCWVLNVSFGDYCFVDADESTLKSSLHAASRRSLYALPYMQHFPDSGQSHSREPMTQAVLLDRQWWLKSPGDAVNKVGQQRSSHYCQIKSPHAPIQAKSSIVYTPHVSKKSNRAISAISCLWDTPPRPSTCRAMEKDDFKPNIYTSQQTAFTLLPAHGGPRSIVCKTPPLATSQSVLPKVSDLHAASS